MGEISQGQEDKCLRSFVMSGDRSPAGTVSAAEIDSFPQVLRSTGANTLTCTACSVLKYSRTEANSGQDSQLRCPDGVRARRSFLEFVRRGKKRQICCW